MARQIHMYHGDMTLWRTIIHMHVYQGGHFALRRGSKLARPGRAANNCTTCLSGFKHKCDVISITIMFASQNSSDLDVGRRPDDRAQIR